MHSSLDQGVLPACRCWHPERTCPPDFACRHRTELERLHRRRGERAKRWDAAYKWVLVAGAGRWFLFVFLDGHSKVEMEVCSVAASILCGVRAADMPRPSCSARPLQGAAPGAGGCQGAHGGVCAPAAVPAAAGGRRAGVGRACCARQVRAAPDAALSVPPDMITCSVCTAVGTCQHQ